MRPLPDDEIEDLEPDMNKKRKGKAAVDQPDRTASLTSGSNPDIEGEDDDGSPLRRRIRSSARDLQAPRLEAAESGIACSGWAGEQRVLEEDTDVAFARRTVGVDAEGPELGDFQKRRLLFGEIGKPNKLISYFPVSSGELRDAEGMVGVTAGTPPKGGDFIANIFDGVINMADLDISDAVKAAEKSMQHVIVFPYVFLFILRRYSPFFLPLSLCNSVRRCMTMPFFSSEGNFFAMRRSVITLLRSCKTRRLVVPRETKNWENFGLLWRCRSRRRPALLLKYSASLMPALLPRMHTCFGLLYSSTFPSL